MEIGPFTRQSGQMCSNAGGIKWIGTKGEPFGWNDQNHSTWVKFTIWKYTMRLSDESGYNEVTGV